MASNVAEATSDRNSACGEVGTAAPVIDRKRCEGKGDCVRVCPYGVFSIRKLEPSERVGLSLIARLKACGHGYKQAFVDPELCHACGLCVPACPEKAIKLRPA